VAGAIVIVEPPGFATRVSDIFKVGNAGIVIPNLAPTPWTDVEDVIKSRLDNTAVANRNDYIVPVRVTVEKGRSLAQ